jgi:ABC-2 type transport system ATP-binding protein
MPTIRIESLNKTFQVKKKQAGLGASFKGLIKPVYEEKLAVNDINFTVEQGELLAFLGPNGAGKSTTIKMLTGILHPSSGSAEVLGYSPWNQRKKLSFHIGSVFGQKSQLWYHLPPSDTFELMSRIYEIRRSDYLERRDYLVRSFELEPYFQIPVRKMSLGERMRCEIAVALLHRPKVVFLDEPTIGLDVVVKLKIRELIREMNREEGTTIFLTSHDAGDVEQLCERAIVINHGKIILDDKVTKLKKDLLTHKKIRLLLAEEPPSFAIEGATLISRDGLQYTLSVDTSLVPIESVLEQLIHQCRIHDVTIEDPPMEEIITHIYDQKNSSPAWGRIE